MKKIKISLTIATLLLAIAGSTMASKVQKKVDPCKDVDPFGIVCLNENNDPCCEPETGNPPLTHKNN